MRRTKEEGEGVTGMCKSNCGGLMRGVKVCRGGEVSRSERKHGCVEVCFDE